MHSCQCNANDIWLTKDLAPKIVKKDNFRKKTGLSTLSSVETAAADKKILLGEPAIKKMPSDFKE